MLIPVALGMLHPETGASMVTVCPEGTVLQLKEASQSYTFDNVPVNPVLSIFRGFSAPVNVVYAQQTDEDLLFLMAHDTDSFNRWDGGNRYLTKLLLSIAEERDGEIREQPVAPALIDALRNVLTSLDSGVAVEPSLIAYALQLPDETTLLNQMKENDIDRIHLSRAYVKEVIAAALAPEFRATYDALAIGSRSTDEYKFNAAEVGRRKLRNTCLDYMCTGTAAGISEGIKLAKIQFDESNCMSDRLSALSILANKGPAYTESVEAIADFYTTAAGNALVLNKWFTIQATADYDGLLTQVKELKSHPDFLISNPNRARSLIGAFMSNLYHFHKADGQGYRFMKENILELDKLNPQVAARMAGCFSQWKKYGQGRQTLMEGELKDILATEGLSRDTFEVVNRCLG